MGADRAPEALGGARQQCDLRGLRAGETNTALAAVGLLLLANVDARCGKRYGGNREGDE